MKFVRREETRELIIADNGIGIPFNFDIENSSAHGFQLVTVLFERLDAKLQIIMKVWRSLDCFGHLNSV